MFLQYTACLYNGSACQWAHQCPCYYSPAQLIVAVTNEPLHDKTKKMTCSPSEDRSAWASTQSDHSALCTQRVAKDPSFLHVGSEDRSDWVDAQADTLIGLGRCPG